MTGIAKGPRYPCLHAGVASGGGRGRNGNNDADRGDQLKALMFLSKGLAPVLINKLNYGPRDPSRKMIVGNDWNTSSTR